MRRAPIWLAVSLAVVTAVLLPFAGSVPGPVSVTFLPFFLTAVSAAEGMTALLLVFQFMAEGDRRLLLLATAYAWTASVIIPHAIVFPGVVFAQTPWAPVSAAVWLWVAWHVGFPVLAAAAVGPWWMKSARRFVPTGERGRTAIRTFGVEALVLIGVALIASRTDWLPVVIAQGDYQKLTRDFGWIILGANISAVAIVARGWSSSNRMEKWVLVAVVACAGDVFLTLFAEGRFTAGWYAGRLMNLISAATLLVAILVATNRLYRQIAAANVREVKARELMRASADALLDPQVLLEAVRDTSGRITDFTYRGVNRATCDYLGLSPEDLLGRGVVETMPGLGKSLLASFVRCVETGESVVLDDFSYDNEIRADTRRYDLRATRATSTSISLTWRDVTERFRSAQLLAEARALQSKADRRYRRLVDNSGIGMGLLAPDGQFESVNQAMCDFFGYDAATLRTKTWQELTAPEYMDADRKNIEELLAGRSESYRMDKQYVHADGHLIWGDLSVSCLRTTDGEVEDFVPQIIDITAEVEARQKLALRDEQNRLLAQGLQAQQDLLKSDLRSAAAYVSSVLPDDIENGPVQVSSRYLPSQELAGDCFDYRWVDDDHMIAYLLDVSGHGIEPALLSISVHNMLRSGSLPLTTLLAPEQVLSELNRRFQMDKHSGHYFTMWFGVYEKSTRELRYASAGAPPALACNFETGTPAVAELDTPSLPVGMFEDTTFSSRSYSVPPGARILLYSDGAYELALDEGRQLSLADFKTTFTRLAGPNKPSLDGLVEELRGLTPSGTFDDDCSLVQLVFD